MIPDSSQMVIQVVVTVTSSPRDVLSVAHGFEFSSGRTGVTSNHDFFFFQVQRRFYPPIWLLHTSGRTGRKPRTSDLALVCAAILSTWAFENISTSRALLRPTLAPSAPIPATTSRTSPPSGTSGNLLATSTLHQPPRGKARRTIKTWVSDIASAQHQVLTVWS